MKNGIQEVIEKLEQQKTAIERALTALRGVEGFEAESSEPVETASAAPRKAVKKGGMTPEGRRRLSEALRKRWAAKKAGTAPAPNARASATPAKSAAKTTAKAPAKKQGGMTPEGRQRLSEALRKRWAAKRAGQGGTAQTSTKKKAPRK
jgi:hypothetical protein